MIVDVNFKVEIPSPSDGITRQEIEEWLEYCFGHRASLSCDNPLAEHDAEAMSGTFWCN